MCASVQFDDLLEVGLLLSSFVCNRSDGEGEGLVLWVWVLFLGRGGTEGGRCRLCEVVTDW